MGRIWIEFTRFMIKLSDVNTLDKKEEMQSMEKENISSKKVGPTMKVNGETTRCKEKVKPILSRANFSIQDNGNPISTMAGAFYIQILHQILNGCLTKDNLKMV